MSVNCQLSTVNCFVLALLFSPPRGAAEPRAAGGLCVKDILWTLAAAIVFAPLALGLAVVTLGLFVAARVANAWGGERPRKVKK